MKKLLEEYSRYHIWANKLLMNVILALPPDQQARNIPSSFPGFHQTLHHMLMAEWVWWKRVTAEKPVIQSIEPFNGNLKELCELLQNQSQLWKEWIQNRTITAFEEIVSYTTANGISNAMPLYQIVLHVHNHGTYHRGQLVTMLREIEVNKIPQTDFSAWTREQVQK